MSEDLKTKCHDDHTKSPCCQFKNPTPICFEERLEGFQLNGCCQPCGTMTISEGARPAPCDKPPCQDWGPNPTNLIRTDQEWGIAFQWGHHGGIGEVLEGTWTVDVYLHRVDDSGVIHRENFAEHKQLCDACYHVDVAFKPNDVKPGIYQIYGAVSFTMKNGKHASISGIAEGPAVRFFEPR